MSMEARAAQFAPCAALTGYNEAIEAAAREAMDEMEEGHTDIK